MTARAEPVTDRHGRVWSGMTHGFGSYRRTTALLGTNIDGTQDDALYEVGAWGMTGMVVPVPVPAAGTYRVRLLLAEPRFTEPGQRMMDITAEGRPAATGIDIAAAVGMGAAHDVTFETPVADGLLTLHHVPGRLHCRRRDRGHLQ